MLLAMHQAMMHLGSLEIAQEAQELLSAFP